MRRRCRRWRTSAKRRRRSSRPGRETKSFSIRPSLPAASSPAAGCVRGLNNVIRSIVLTLTYAYGVSRMLGFRYGYAGLAAKSGFDPIWLTPEVVENIHEHGGTLLGSSRGPQDVVEMVDTLVARKVGVLFAIGGDGTLRGASALSQEIARRGLPISVIGVPKTIDNDLEWIERSFGFATAVEAADNALVAAHAEARGAWNGVGLVKLMGRDSGFIAAHTSSGQLRCEFLPDAGSPLSARWRSGLFARLGSASGFKASRRGGGGGRGRARPPAVAWRPGA